MAMEVSAVRIAQGELSVVAMEDETLATAETVGEAVVARALEHLATLLFLILWLDGANMQQLLKVGSMAMGSEHGKTGWVHQTWAYTIVKGDPHQLICV